MKKLCLKIRNGPEKAHTVAAARGVVSCCHSPEPPGRKEEPTRTMGQRKTSKGLDSLSRATDILSTLLAQQVRELNARQRFAGKSPQLKSFFSFPGNFRELHGFCPEGSNRVMQHFVIFLKEIRPCSDRFIQKLHVYEKLCLLRKLFCPLKIPFVETAQKKSQILVDLFSCRPLRRRL